MPKRGKKVTEEKKARVLAMLHQNYSVEYVASNQGISEREVRKIRLEALRKEEQRKPEELRGQFKAQLTVPPPENIIIDNFGTPGSSHSIPLKEVLYRVSWQNTGYGAGVVKLAKERGLTAAEDEINVVVLPDGSLELYCPVEKHELFPRLLSSLSQKAQEHFVLWKPRGGEYLAACTDVRWQIHTDANDRVFQLVFYEIGREAFTQIGQPYITPDFGDTVYHLCILHHSSSGRLSLPAKSQYRVWPRSPIFYELYMGYRRLVTTPGSPRFLPPGAPPPSFPSEILMRWADLHRDMIKDWSASPAIAELQELFESLRRIEGEIKEELG
jgi:hypothetical protein